MKLFQTDKGDLKAAVVNLVKNLPIAIKYMAAATLVSTIFFHLSNNVTNISIIFTLAIILIARTTSCYGSEMLASLFAVFWVNFAYTYPYMTLNFAISGCPITFVGVMLISYIISGIYIMIAKQNAQIQEKDRMLLNTEKETMGTNLMRAMSHDLHTPLATTISSSSTYLEQEKTISPDEKHKLAQNIKKDTQWLLTMVENLLTVTRIQDERSVANVIKTGESLEEIAPSAMRRFRKRFMDVPVHVSIPDIFIMVPMDATLIEQVTNDLLENAFSHSGSYGPIDLIVITDGSYMPITIKDYGKGIHPDLLDTPLDGRGVYANQIGDSRKGIGIGLSLCKTIMGAHGGQIRAGNHQNGAQFTLTSPGWRGY